MTRWAAALVLVLLAGLGGCSSGQFADGCLPEPLQVDPAEVAAGATVTLSSVGSSCDGGYDDGHEYELTLALFGRADAVDLGDVPVRPDGSFRAQLTVPADVPPGPAAFGVRGSPFDDCDDIPGASCSGYSVEFTVVPAG